jgi:uncharacterized protein YjbI with pentapeptide repeats
VVAAPTIAVADFMAQKNFRIIAKGDRDPIAHYCNPADAVAFAFHATLWFPIRMDARLISAKLIQANLNGVDLRVADLSVADLSNADLTVANLVGAQLGAADLSHANLSHANLSHANLNGTNLHTATLSGTVLRYTVFIQTFFTDVDLSNVIGLDTCKHDGPSSIDFRTLRKSPNLPLVFLRGVGLPDRLIDYLPSLLNQAIQFYSCFISYSAKDQDVADRLYADLQNKGVRCWFDRHDLPIGAKTRDYIDETIKLQDKLLLILSEHSIWSDWVEDEVTAAFERRGQARRATHAISDPPRRYRHDDG